MTLWNEGVVKHVFYILVRDIRSSSKSTCQHHPNSACGFNCGTTLSWLGWNFPHKDCKVFNLTIKLKQNCLSQLVLA